MGESASARTQRELADLRRSIGRDVDALVARARHDADPRNIVRRNPVAAIGSLASVAAAGAVALSRRARERRTAEGRVDELVERFGGRIDKLRGKARKRFRDQLRKEMAEVSPAGPREAVWAAGATLLTTLAADAARRLGARLLGDDEGPGA